MDDMATPTVAEAVALIASSPNPEAMGDAIRVYGRACVLEHEAALKERGWWDEYEVETNIAMNYGEGMAEGATNERQRIADAVRGLASDLIDGPLGDNTVYRVIERAAVLRIIEPTDG